VTSTKETLQSSVVLLGLDGPSPDVDAAVRRAVAKALDVEETQVVILSSEVISEGDGRRLSAGLQVSFEVVFDSVAAVDESAKATSKLVAGNGSKPAPPSLLSAGSASMTSALESLKEMSSNPAVFQKQLTVAFEEQGTVAPASLQIQVSEPTVQRVVVLRVAGPWHACQASMVTEDPCDDRPGKQARNISCASATNLSARPHEALCLGLPELLAVSDCVIAGEAGGACTTTSTRVALSPKLSEQEALPPKLSVTKSSSPEGSGASGSGMSSELMLSGVGLLLLMLCICACCLSRRLGGRFSWPNTQDEDNNPICPSFINVQSVDLQKASDEEDESRSGPSRQSSTRVDILEFSETLPKTAWEIGLANAVESATNNERPLADCSDGSLDIDLDPILTQFELDLDIVSCLDDIASEELCPLPSDSTGSWLQNGAGRRQMLT